MNNILITSNFKITKETYGAVNHKGYNELTELCVKSFCKNINGGVQQVIILRDEVESYHKMNKQIYTKIKDIYFNDRCNILYVDSDTICVKPIDMWHNDIFRMFVIKDEFRRSAYPKNVPKYLFECFPYWFMSNIRYYPAGMDHKVWDIGDELYNRWIDVWAYECIIYNAMFYSQRIINPFEYSDELMNFQYTKGQTDYDLIDYANIIHVQATRGIDDAVKRVKDRLNKIS